jgi:hypothetical protein
MSKSFKFWPSLPTLVPPLLIAALATYAGVLASWVKNSSVNIPYWDEWETLTPVQMGQGIFGRWILDHHNEHRVVSANFIWALNAAFFGLDLRLHVFLNFAFYLALAALFWRFVRPAVGASPLSRAAAVVCLFPLASDMFPINHLMAGQSCVHLCLAGFLAGTLLLFGRESWVRLAGTAALWVLSMFSFASGLVAAWTGLLVFAAFELRRTGRIWTARWVTLASTIFIFSVLWFVGYRPPLGHPRGSFPWEFRFMRFFFELAAFGVGATGVHLGAALLVAGLIIGILRPTWIAARAGFIHSRAALNPRPIAPELRQRFAVFCALAGLLAAFAAITYGRARFGVEHAKADRYAEFAVLLPGLLYALARLDFPARRCAGLLIAIVGLGFWDKFSPTPYENYAAPLRRGEACVRQYLTDPSSNPTGLCPDLYPGPIGERIDFAHRMDFSFARTGAVAPAN